MKKIWFAGACVMLLVVAVLWIARERPDRHMQTLTPTVEGMALSEDAVQKTARSWMNAVLKGQLDKLSAQAETPFCLLNEMVDTTVALQTKLDALMKSAALAKISNLHAGGGFPITRVQVLEGERASFAAGRSFKSLDTTGLKLVMVRLSGEVGGERGGFDFVVVVKPGEQLRVVGFGND